MGLKDRLLQAKCKVGVHSGEWKQLAAGSCDEQRTCVNCAEVSNRTEHYLSDWEYSADPAAPACTRERGCQRCSLVERNVEHTMDWQYVHTEETGWKAAGTALLGREERCRQALICSRCGLANGKSKIRHRWDAGFEVRDAESGEIKRLYTCMHCRREDIRGRMQAARS